MSARKNGIGTPIRARNLPQHGPWLHPDTYKNTADALAWFQIEVQAALAPMLYRLASFLRRFEK